MLPVSEAVLAALPGALQRPYRADWSNDGGRTWTPCGLQAGSAQINASRTAETRYTGGATLTGVSSGAAGINPISTNLRLWQGVQLPRAQPVWFPVGRYTVGRPRQTRTGLEVELAGIEDEIRSAGLPTARTVGPGDARGLVETLVGEALPGVPVAWRAGVNPDVLVPQLLAEDSRWSVLSSGTDSSGTSTGIVESLAAEIFADARGVITVAPVPTLADAVVWRIGRGPGGVLIEPQTEQSSEGLANVWAVTGDAGSGESVIGPAYAWDDDPGSLTYAGPDPVGDPLAPQRLGLWHVRLRVQRHTSAVITGLTQAYEVAQAKLADSLGVQYALSLTAVCNPALEPGDVIEVEVTPGVWEKHLVDSLSYTLGAASMSLTTRTSARRL
ncbi:phage tail protein [Streptomyces scabiei]|uniref:phage tail protein n=1 Tax=Streptomyces scabiei TaxID=1930 RepID=UPI0029AF942F|nr:phage tail protein [Streptomyces scabiei]MDX3199963.1 phage tail protein [Streptomyces scabiei]MDX3217757.1 phage tail protein [Streptomyces scabiei]